LAIFRLDIKHMTGRRTGGGGPLSGSGRASPSLAPSGAGTECLVTFWLVTVPGLWIRIGSGFSEFVDPDPYWESGSRIRIQGQENKEISVEKCTF
jgi:hypothetical protein